MRHLLLCIFATASMVAAADGDTTTLKSRWHIMIGMSSPDFSSSENLRSSYAGSQYPFIAIPKIYHPQIGIQRNITRRLRVGSEFKILTPVSYRASNWYKLITNSRNAPEARFDVRESASGFSNDLIIHFVVVPARYAISRFEIAVTAGMTTSYMTDKVRHDYIFCRGSTCGQDTTFTKSVSETLVGGVLALNIEFYWSRLISTQFRMTGRSTSSMTIKPLRYTYTTLDSRGNPVQNERPVEGHKFGLSGVDMALNLLIHL